jgi:hypothetical protein
MMNYYLSKMNHHFLKPNMSKIEDSVCKKILDRAKVGKEKYGVTMERDDLSFKEWMIHLQEELMDAIVYIEKNLEESGKK